MKKPTYQQRVIDEAAALDSNIGKLQTFINTPEAFSGMPALQQELLTEQAKHMQAYSGTLHKRIATF